MGVEPQINFLPARNEVVHAYSSHEKVGRVFGDLIRNVPLREGIAKMAAWAKRAGARQGKRRLGGMFEQFRRELPAGFIFNKDHSDFSGTCRVVGTSRLAGSSGPSLLPLSWGAALSEMPWAKVAVLAVKGARGWPEPLWVAAGEAAGHIKTTTGGGIYYGLLSAELVADVVTRAFRTSSFSSRTLGEFERYWRSAFGNELMVGYFARKLAGHWI